MLKISIFLEKNYSSTFTCSMTRNFSCIFIQIFPSKWKHLLCLVDSVVNGSPVDTLTRSEKYFTNDFLSFCVCLFVIPLISQSYPWSKSFMFANVILGIFFHHTNTKLWRSVPFFQIVSDECCWLVPVMMNNRPRAI